MAKFMSVHPFSRQQLVPLVLIAAPNLCIEFWFWKEKILAKKFPPVLRYKRTRRRLFYYRRNHGGGRIISSAETFGEFRRRRHGLRGTTGMASTMWGGK